MPCDQVRTTVIEVEKLDKSVLTKALQALGYDVSEAGEALLFSTKSSRFVHRYEAGRFTLSNIGQNEAAWINNIKQAYSVEAVKTAAARFGWNLKPNVKNQYAFTASRRG